MIILLKSFLGTHNLNSRAKKKKKKNALSTAQRLQTPSILRFERKKKIFTYSTPNTYVHSFASVLFYQY